MNRNIVPWLSGINYLVWMHYEDEKIVESIYYSHSAYAKQQLLPDWNMLLAGSSRQQDEQGYYYTCCKHDTINLPSLHRLLLSFWPTSQGYYQGNDPNGSDKCGCASVRFENHSGSFRGSPLKAVASWPRRASSLSPFLYSSLSCSLATERIPQRRSPTQKKQSTTAVKPITKIVLVSMIFPFCAKHSYPQLLGYHHSVS